MPPRVGIIRRTLSRVMREARRTKGIQGTTAAAQMGFSAGTLSKYERSEHPWPPPVVYALADMYGMDPADRDRLVELAKERDLDRWWPSVPDWFAPYLGAESEAEAVYNYDDGLIPGLAQTPEYARALIEAMPNGHDPQQINDHVTARVRRQRRLTEDHPLQVTAVFNESALHREVGGVEVMREQLAHLLEVSRLPNVDLRCLPFNAGAHAGTEGNFVILRFPVIIDDVVSGDAVYIEYARGGLFLERPVDTEHYHGLFEKIQQRALGPEQTRQLVQHLLDDKYGS
ncbi:helix-turn-helix domain-containing protein [Nocardiopsis alborubida]|uniref:Helix-turn-helix domain-containing protein n=1 Tax=Nocardiopsis alborubida TaxID=146802 RepID=A0A7X6M915_9ACTN|nr:helix-turn-helix transcriptional regulator [Nocardiopsis alborubida]NKY96620.1 helix-turn-helix domain-containing protein [Nocardiopsis alborubida]